MSTKEFEQSNDIENNLNDESCKKMETNKNISLLPPNLSSDKFEKISLQYALDHFEEMRYQYMKEEPLLLERTNRLGLDIPAELIEPEPEPEPQIDVQVHSEPMPYPEPTQCYRDHYVPIKKPWYYWFW
tara:strand:+ start:14022 stop:14408 length:387 start_codon:yes stop_codon:yes gene_type:complete